MPGQNNMYGSQDDPFGYGQQQAYWQQQRAADAAKSLTPATKPLPIKQTVPTTPQVQPRPTPQEQPYQSPYGRGYVPQPQGSQQMPNPGLINGTGGSMEPWLDAGMTYEQWKNRFGTAPVPNPSAQFPPWAVQPMPNPGAAQGNGGMTNYGLVWRTGPNGERVNIPVDAIGTPRDPQSPNYQPITVGPTPPPGFDNIQMPPWAVKPMPNPIWNGPVPPRQELPEDMMGLSRIYGAPIPEGQTWNQWNPNRGYNPGGGQWQQPTWELQQPIPQWYTARLQQQR